MENSSPLSSASRYLGIVLILLLCQAPISHTSAHTFVTRLIHYLATDSPLYDPTKSTWELSHRDLEYSMRRASYLTANTSALADSSGLYSTQIDTIRVGFLAHMQVGSQLIEQHVFMDTGSSFLWVNCEPCSIIAPSPIYDPKGSTSYAVDTCSSDLCGGTGGMKVTECNRGLCKYIIQYGSDSSKGHVARETFKFGADNLTNIFFGCSRYTTISKSNGILGLAANHISLVSQLKANRFAYCFGNISDVEYRSNTLAIGQNMVIPEQKIPLIVEDKYYINLEGIAIGNKVLDIDPKMFRRVSEEYRGGMIIDAGSTYSYIPQVALDKVQNEVISIIDNFVDVSRNDSITDSRGYKLLCYNGILSESLFDFPTMIFQFEGGATVEFDAENVFRIFSDGTFCFAILPSELLKADVSLMGNIMQQYFRVSFDLVNNFVGFDKIDCRQIAYV